MSPVDRLEWLRALALTKAPGYALRVGAVLALHANSASGESRPGLRNALGADDAKRGAAWLRSHGWVQVGAAPLGKATSYTLTRGTEAPGAPKHPGHRSTTPRGTEAPGPGAPKPPEPGIPSIEPRILAKPHDEVPPGGASAGRAFLLKDGEVWTMPSDLLATLTRAYPGKNVEAELDKAAAWLVCNPTRRKTDKGMPRCLNGWLRRAKECAPAATPFPTLPPDDDDDDGVHYRPTFKRAAQ